MPPPRSELSGGRRVGPFDDAYWQRREILARQLLPAVERLLEQATYRELTIAEIVAEAAISRSTFYNYFEDKSDLLGALTAQVMGALVDAAELWWTLPVSAQREDLRGALAHLFAVYRPHADLMRAVAESTTHDERVEEAFLGFMQGGYDGVLSWIQRGRAAGTFRRDLDAERAATLLDWMVERGLSQLSGSRNHELNPLRAVAAMTDVIWKAVR